MKHLILISILFFKLTNALAYDLNKAPTPQNPVCASNQLQLNQNWFLKAVTFGEPVFNATYVLKSSKATSATGSLIDFGASVMFSTLKVKTKSDGSILVVGVGNLTGGEYELDRGRLQVCHDGKNLYTLSTTGKSGTTKKIIREKADGKKLNVVAQGVEREFTRVSQ